MASATRSLTAAADHVTLAPYDDWYLATFYGDDPERPCDVYVDIATPAVWYHGESRLRAVDLDLDVIRGTTGRVWVDDEDEFAEHRVSRGYPADVVSGAMASCDRVHAAVRDREPPFDGTSQAAGPSHVRLGRPLVRASGPLLPVHPSPTPPPAHPAVERSGDGYRLRRLRRPDARRRVGVRPGRQDHP